MPDHDNVVIRRQPLRLTTPHEYAARPQFVVLHETVVVVVRSNLQSPQGNRPRMRGWRFVPGQALYGCPQGDAVHFLRDLEGDTDPGINRVVHISNLLQRARAYNE